MDACMNTRFVKSNKSLSLIIKDSEFIRNIETKGIKITNLLNGSQARNREAAQHLTKNCKANAEIRSLGNKKEKVMKRANSLQDNDLKKPPPDHTCMAVTATLRPYLGWICQFIELQRSLRCNWHFIKQDPK